MLKNIKINIFILLLFKIDVSKKGMEFVYKMIETLLPKAQFSNDNPVLKMMELYSQDP